MRGTRPALDLLERARAELPADFPLLLAGGIAERADVAAAIEAGAEGALCGTRFLLSEESRAHPGYRERLLEAEATILTELFGTGWPAAHRVIANAATEHWLGEDPRGPALNRAAQPHSPASAPATRRSRSRSRSVRRQRPRSRMLSPQGPIDDGPASLLDAGPLYAGETVARISAVRPAAALVAELTP